VVSKSVPCRQCALLCLILVKVAVMVVSYGRFHSRLSLVRIAKLVQESKRVQYNGVSTAHFCFGGDSASCRGRYACLIRPSSSIG